MSSSSRHWISTSPSSLSSSAPEETLSLVAHTRSRHPVDCQHHCPPRQEEEETPYESSFSSCEPFHNNHERPNYHHHQDDHHQPSSQRRSDSDRSRQHSSEDRVQPHHVAAPQRTPLAIAPPSGSSSGALRSVKHKRRYCRVPGCQSIVKSQGVCQRHGAKPRKCRVPGCDKQAQGNFDGMCKVHFKSSTMPLLRSSNDNNSGRAPNPDSAGMHSAGIATALGPPVAPPEFRPPFSSLLALSSTRRPEAPPQPTSTLAVLPPRLPSRTRSVYDTIIPASVELRLGLERENVRSGTTGSAAAGAGPAAVSSLVEHIVDRGGCLPSGWHRREERTARGLPPLPPESSLEESSDADAVTSWTDWEQELLWTELLLLTTAEGGRSSEGLAPQTSAVVLDGLAHAWGRPPGFHREFVTQWIGERRTRSAGTGSPTTQADSENAPPRLSDGDDEEDDDDLGCFDDDEEEGYDADDGMVHQPAVVGGASGAVVDADAWEGSCYTADSYDEALASELLLEHLASTSPPHTPIATPDGLHLKMDRHHRGGSGEDGSDGDGDFEFEDDNDRVTDDASTSSREDSNLPVDIDPRDYSGDCR